MSIKFGGSSFEAYAEITIRVPLEALDSCVAYNVQRTDFLQMLGTSVLSELKSVKSLNKYLDLIESR